MFDSLSRLTARDIAVGLPVPCDCYDANGRLLMPAGHILNNPAQWQALLDSGLYTMTAGAVAEQAVPVSFRAHYETLRERLKKAFDALEQAQDAAFRTLIHQAIRDTQRLADKDPDRLLVLVHLYRDADHNIAKALMRAALCELVSRPDLPGDKARVPIVGAALTADFSLHPVQDEMRHRTGPLEEHHRKTIDHHSRLSALNLLEAGITDEIWLNSILHHHERRDGSGYPYGLVGDQIHPVARLLAIADVYSAMVLPRHYRPTQLPRNCLRELLQKSERELDPVLCRRLIKLLGIYPPGSLVRLENQDTAVVVERGEDLRSPWVVSLLSPGGDPLDTAVKRSSSEEGFRIVKPVEALDQPDWTVSMLLTET